MKMNLNDAMKLARGIKQYNYKYLTFYTSVGDHASFVERIYEYDTGRVRCDFFFHTYPKYKYKKYGVKNKRVSLTRR